MPARAPLTKSERKQIQWAYHKGMEARKAVIRKLFGREVSRASSLARLANEFVEMKAYATSVTEEEYWELLCCAAFHNKLWEYPSSSKQGDIFSWFHNHCLVMGNVPKWKKEGRFETFGVPPLVPSTWKIKAYKYGTAAAKGTAKLVGPAALLFLGYFLERIAASLFP
ncbi:MAG: hypothetical protein J4G17_09245 [Anaerolineae bacterium]|nr:hypothetical protein [Anaerolineae bacterium]